MPASAPLYQQWISHYLLAQPEPTQQTAQAPVVIISSGAAFEYWRHLVATTQAIETKPVLTEHSADSQTNSALTLADFDYIVLGDRLAAFLHEHQLTYYQVESLDPATIVAAVAKLASSL